MIMRCKSLQRSIIKSWANAVAAAAAVQKRLNAFDFCFLVFGSPFKCAIKLLVWPSCKCGSQSTLSFHFDGVPMISGTKRSTDDGLSTFTRIWQCQCGTMTSALVNFNTLICWHLFRADEGCNPNQRERRQRIRHFIKSWFHNHRPLNPPNCHFLQESRHSARKSLQFFFHALHSQPNRTEGHFDTKITNQLHFIGNIQLAITWLICAPKTKTKA